MLSILLKILGTISLIAGIFGLTFSPWWVLAFPIAVILLYSSLYLGD